MATQGLITIREGQEVVMKIVTGADGYNAKKAARTIRALGRVPTAQEAMDIAKRWFHSPESLVVVTKETILYEGDDGVESLDPRYRNTFTNPEFNPRWDNGTVEYLEIIDF